MENHESFLPVTHTYGRRRTFLYKNTTSGENSIIGFIFFFLNRALCFFYEGLVSEMGKILLQGSSRHGKRYKIKFTLSERPMLCCEARKE